MPKNFKNIKDYISILLHLDLSLNCYTLGIIKLRNAITREIAAKTIINKELQQFKLTLNKIVKESSRPKL